MAELSKHRAGIWIIDNQGNTTFANGRMAEILETTPEAMKGRPSFDHVFPEDVATAQKLFSAKQRGDMDPFEFRIRTAKNRAVWVEVQGTPMHDGNSTFQGIVGTFTVLDHPRA